MRFTLLLKDICNQAAFAAFDFLVEVDEFPPQFLCQPAAYSSFTSAHESDEVHARMCHCSSLYRRELSDIPLLSRRGGCAIPKWSRSFDAQAGWFVPSNKIKVLFASVYQEAARPSLT